MSKMKILQINTVYKKGSTGKIVAGIETVCNERDIETYVAYRYFENPDAKENEISVSSWLDCHVHNRISTYTGFQGVFSYFKTKKFLKKIGISPLEAYLKPYTRCLKAQVRCPK